MRVQFETDLSCRRHGARHRAGAAVLSRLATGPKPAAVVLGNEENGLAPATLGACGAILTIPGSGLAQSLNVAAPAAILMHDLVAFAGSSREAPPAPGRKPAGRRVSAAG